MLFEFQLKSFPLVFREEGLCYSIPLRLRQQVEKIEGSVLVEQLQNFDQERNVYNQNYPT